MAPIFILSLVLFVRNQLNNIYIRMFVCLSHAACLVCLFASFRFVWLNEIDKTFLVIQSNDETETTTAMIWNV